MSTSDMPANRGGRTPVPPRGGKKARPHNRPAPRRPAPQRQAPAKRTPARGGPAAWQARRRRRNITIAVSAVAVVVVVVGVLVGIRLSGGKSGGGQAGLVANVKPNPAPASVVQQVTSVPVSAMAQAANGKTIISGMKALKNEPPLKFDGKPGVLYLGAEYCPYCAIERWGLVAALAKFGTFHNLGQTTSSAHDVYPNSPTLSFYGATYTSKYITLQAKELQTNQPINGNPQNGYSTLQTPTAAQTALWKKVDPDGESYPFVNIGNKVVVYTAPVNMYGLLSNKTLEYVAGQMGNNNTPVGKGLNQIAGVLTKNICSITHGQPGNVCQAINKAS